MAKNSSHGTPEQFENLVRRRIEELSGSVESTTKINADADLESWELLGSKRVLDVDGSRTAYNLWFNPETEMYACTLGDKPDYETYSKLDAYEWFHNYDAADSEDVDDIYYNFYGEIDGSVSSDYSPVVAKDNGMGDPGYVSLVIDSIPDLLIRDGVADEVTKVSQAEGNIVFTFKKDGNKYTASFPEYELTGSDPDDLPDDEWLIEDAARAVIYGINSATNTCNMPSKIDADMEEIPDYTDVVIEGSDGLSTDVAFTNINDVIGWLNRNGIDTTKHRYELQAKEYRRYEHGPTYRYRFTAPGDWVAYFAMLLHRDMSPDAVVERINGYFDDEDTLAEISSIPAIRDLATQDWWGDGDDFIHYLKNLDTGEMLYEVDPSVYDYDDDDWDVE